MLKATNIIGRLLSHPSATIAIAGSLSLMTLAASLYLFMFAGRGLLPSPPVADLSIPQILEPVPIGSIVAPAGSGGPEIGVSLALPLTPFTGLSTASLGPVGTALTASVTAPQIFAAALPAAAPSENKTPSSGGMISGPETDQYTGSFEESDYYRGNSYKSGAIKPGRTSSKDDHGPPSRGSGSPSHESKRSGDES